jgi:hypothetical protein
MLTIRRLDRRLSHGHNEFMRRRSLSLLTGGLFFVSFSAWSQINSCDLVANGTVDAADVQAAINMSLGISPCTANIAGANVCNIVIVQRVVNASLGGTCFTSAGIHSVSLTWTASTSPGVTGYRVYRGTISNGPYSLVASLGNVTSYTDNGVLSGTTYYYVVRAVDASNNESSDSNQAPAAIPIP